MVVEEGRRKGREGSEGRREEGGRQIDMGSSIETCIAHTQLSSMEPLTVLTSLPLFF